MKNALSELFAAILDEARCFISNTSDYNAFQTNTTVAFNDFASSNGFPPIV